FLLNHDPVAAALLVRILNNTNDASARTALAEHYAREGYAAAAMFFRSSASLLSEPSTSPPRLKQSYAWRCEMPDTDHTRAIGLETADLVKAGKYSEAFAKATVDAQRYKTCSVILAWADAVRMQAEAHVVIDAADRELASRALVTLAEEAKEFPESSRHLT